MPIDLHCRHYVIGSEGLLISNLQKCLTCASVTDTPFLSVQTQIIVQGSPKIGRGWKTARHVSISRVVGRLSVPRDVPSQTGHLLGRVCASQQRSKDTKTGENIRQQRHAETLFSHNIGHGHVGNTFNYIYQSYCSASIHHCKFTSQII